MSTAARARALVCELWGSAPYGCPELGPVVSGEFLNERTNIKKKIRFPCFIIHFYELHEFRTWREFLVNFLNFVYILVLYIPAL